jgi:TetR/AcrR family transcriptional regulator, transcriptional repressor for nem operon
MHALRPEFARHALRDHAQTRLARRDDQITILAGLIAESGSPAAAGERRTLRERAISLHCQMVGALVLSRSVAQVAPALSNDILETVQ